MDGLRQTDWTVTCAVRPPALSPPVPEPAAHAQLVLMAIETDTLIRKLAPTRDSPYFGMLASAVLQPLTQIGTIPRFYMNNLRGSRGEGDEPVAPSLVQIILPVGACVAFGFTTYNTLEHIGPLDEATTRTRRTGWRRRRS